MAAYLLFQELEHLRLNALQACCLPFLSTLLLLFPSFSISQVFSVALACATFFFFQIKNYYSVAPLPHYQKINIKNSSEMWNSCRYHKDAPLQNFCVNKECSMPLCSKCIQPHLCQPLPHKLVSLEEIINDTREYLNVSMKGFRTERNSLEKQMNPDSLRRSYAELVDKYRKQAIEQINAYYKQLQQDIHSNVQKAYSLHLNTFRSQFEQIQGQFKKYERDLNEESTLVPALITINCNNERERAECLFQAFREARCSFKSSLPSLEPAGNGRLELISRIVPYKQLRPCLENTNYTTSRSRVVQERQGNNLSRIARLEGQLHLLRSRCCF